MKMEYASQIGLRKHSFCFQLPVSRKYYLNKNYAYGKGEFLVIPFI